MSTYYDYCACNIRSKHFERSFKYENDHVSNLKILKAIDYQSLHA